MNVSVTVTAKTNDNNVTFIIGTAFGKRHNMLKCRLSL